MSTKSSNKLKTPPAIALPGKTKSLNQSSSGKKMSKVSSTGSPILDKSLKLKYKKPVPSAGESETDARSEEKEAKGAAPAAKPEESKITNQENKKYPNVTYEFMIQQAFTENFNKSKKMRDQGVTYQQIWKDISERHIDAKKNILLKRLAKICNSSDTEDASKNQEKYKKYGQVSKTAGKNRYKFQAPEKIKPIKKAETKLATKTASGKLKNAHDKPEKSKLSPQQKNHKEADLHKKQKLDTSMTSSRKPKVLSNKPVNRKEDKKQNTQSQKYSEKVHSKSAPKKVVKPEKVSKKPQSPPKTGKFGAKIQKVVQAPPKFDPKSKIKKNEKLPMKVTEKNKKVIQKPDDGKKKIKKLNLSPKSVVIQKKGARTSPRAAVQNSQGQNPKKKVKR